MTAISAADWHCDPCKDYRAQVQAIQREAEKGYAQAYKKAKTTPTEKLT